MNHNNVFSSPLNLRRKRYSCHSRYQPRHLRSHACKTGFSLLEVLVALVIVAIALGATLRTARDRTETLDVLRSRTLARWVAKNQLANLERAPSLTSGDTSGEDIQSGQRFKWAAHIDTPLQSTGSYPITLTVTGSMGQQLATQRTWITPPSNTGSAPPPDSQNPDNDLRGPHNEHLHE